MDQICSTCFKPKAHLACVSCHEALCKKCAQFVDEEKLSFLEGIPKETENGVFCIPCFDGTIAPQLATYDEQMKKAEGVYVFFKEQGKETRLIRRSDQTFHVEECADRNETILKLAFFAVRAGFNAVVDIELKYEKTRDGSFKLAKWSGSGTAAHVDPAKMERMK